MTDKIFGTSVTILIVSPDMIQSDWIDWEIKYSMKETTRKDTTSRCNGIVGVIMKVNNSYDWLVSNKIQNDGCTSRFIDSSKLLSIVNENRYNLITDDHFSCTDCKSYSQLDGSFISLIDEDDFLNDPNKYIENAFEKAKKINNYKVVKKEAK